MNELRQKKKDRKMLSEANVKKRKVRESARESEGELVGEIYTVVKDARG